jgi:peroxiredoxin
VQQQLSEFNAAGVRPVAIAVDTPEESRELARKAGYTYPILSDGGAATIARYGILHKGAGMSGRDVARPAEFLVDREGVVRWRNLTEDLRVRARAEEMLAAARTLR